MPNMPTERGLLDAHGAGKGDKERSSSWRKNYDEIDWSGSVSGFTKQGVKQVKVYGAPEARGIVLCPAHGAVALSFSEWQRQVYVDRLDTFICPKCGAVASLVESML